MAGVRKESSGPPVTRRQLDSSAFADVSSARPPMPSGAEVYAALETVDDPVRASDPEAGARPKLLAKHMFDEGRKVSLGGRRGKAESRMRTTSAKEVSSGAESCMPAR